MVVNSCLEDLEGRIEESVEVDSTGDKKEQQMSGGEQ